MNYRRNITASDYSRLAHWLESKPEVVLSHFRRAHVNCLMELVIYRRLCRDRPDTAQRIAKVAAAMGIAIDTC